jgi:hypothetical protein
MVYRLKKMRKLDSDASSTVSQPVKSGTIAHLQLAYQEVATALANNIVGPAYQSTVAYILYGCVNTGTGGAYNISAGAIYFNGEVFLVPAASFTPAGGQTAVGTITTGYFSGANADPVKLSNGDLVNVHEIRTIVIASGVSGSGTADYDDWLQTYIGFGNDQEATLGSSYVVKFNQSKGVFFAAASVSVTFTFDFTNAMPGAVVRLQWDWTASSGVTITVTPGSGAVAYEEGGDITRAATHVNSMYFTYVGVDSSGNNVVGYSISQIG